MSHNLTTRQQTALKALWLLTEDNTTDTPLINVFKLAAIDRRTTNSLEKRGYIQTNADGYRLADNGESLVDEFELVFTIPELAAIASKHLVRDTRNDGTKFYKFDELPEPLSNIICDAAYAMDTDLDSAYENAPQILEAIRYLDSDVDPDDIFDEIVSDLSPDVYTSDLERWLTSNRNHGYYMTQAIEEFDAKDYFVQLSTAQTLYLEELANALIDQLKNIVK